MQPQPKFTKNERTLLYLMLVQSILSFALYSNALNRFDRELQKVRSGENLMNAYQTGEVLGRVKEQQGIK